VLVEGPGRTGAGTGLTLTGGTVSAVVATGVVEDVLAAVEVVDLGTAAGAVEDVVAAAEVVDLGTTAEEVGATVEARVVEEVTGARTDDVAGIVDERVTVLAAPSQFVRPVTALCGSVIVEEARPAFTFPALAIGKVDHTSTRTAPLTKSLGTGPNVCANVSYWPMRSSVVMRGEVASRSQLPSPVKSYDTRSWKPMPTALPSTKRREEVVPPVAFAVIPRVTSVKIEFGLEGGKSWALWLFAGMTSCVASGTPHCRPQGARKIVLH